MTSSSDTDKLTTEPPEEGEEVDEKLVTWGGPDDPENPKNWPLKKKWYAAITVSLFTFISPVVSTMIAPALPSIGHDLHITASIELALTLSIFVAAYGIGPLVWGPLSELRGRVPVLQISNAWFFFFNIGCGFAQNKTTLTVLRFFAGIGGSAPQSVGSGVLSDLFYPEQRGKAISVYSLAPLLGPALGPIAGGWIAELTTWRWVFRSTTIACACIQVGSWFRMTEAYPPKILHAKKKRLMKETGVTDLHTPFDDPNMTYLKKLRVALTRPFRLLFTQPIVMFLAAYQHEKPGIQGLNYIFLAGGLFAGAQFGARMQDLIYANLKRRYCKEGEAGRPEFRVPLMAVGAIFVPIGLLIYAWTAEEKTHWIGPSIGVFIYSFGLIMSFSCLQGYMVDSYGPYAASAVAATTLTRSMAGFGFPLFAADMYNTLGYGWGNTLLAGVAVVIGWPAPLILWLYGAKLRSKSKFAR
ncbi:MFS general substrate transporter [Sarocladium strictum]